MTDRRSVEVQKLELTDEPNQLPSPPARSADEDDIGPTWVLFRPLAHDVPSRMRFRQLLKAALPAYKIRAERIAAIGPNGIDVRDGQPKGDRP
jgi:hypothetical protein